MKKVTIPSILILFCIVVFYFRPQRPLEWQEEKTHRWTELSVPWLGQDGFKQLSESATGVTFENNLTHQQIAGNQHLLNGSGVATGDVDGDGLADIYFCRLNGSNTLYKNLGSWKFEDITITAGVACPDQFSTGAVFADIDGDHDLDLLVTTLGGPNFCFLNDGTGKFKDVTNSAKLAGNMGATTMALADIDGDTDLDLFVANYKKNTIRDRYLPQDLEFDRVVKKTNGSYEITPEFQEHYTVGFFNNDIMMRYENAEPNRLYLNNGSGEFEEVSRSRGRFLDEEGNPATNLKEWSLTARFQDIDRDGDPDLYICNDFESPDRIWINDGSGNFQAIAKLRIRHTSWATMGVDFSDIDRDGDVDFFSLDMLSRDPKRRKTQSINGAPAPPPIGEIDNRPQYSHNALFLNQGDSTYAEIAQFSGVNASGWSWSPLFIDVDLDGFEDILIATGHFYDALDSDTIARIKTTRYASLDTWRNKIFEYPPLEIANVAFRNRHDLTFVETGADWGFASKDISHGIALADFDNDGDQDVVLNRLGAPAAIYRNESTAPRLAVRLRGLSANTRGIGARILVSGGPVPQSKEVVAGGAYLSSSDPTYTFATGRSDNLTIEVHWRNGGTTIVNSVKPNRLYEIYESNDLRPKNATSAHRSSGPYFEDMSNLLRHTHHEDVYNDFRVQPLLPKRLSQLGPGVAWYDLDSDGDDDLAITSGKGGQLTCFRNNGSRGFQRIENQALAQKSDTEQSSVLGWTTEKGIRGLLVGNSNIAQNQREGSFVSRLNFPRATVDGKIAAGASSIGPMAMADYDGDGDLDIFIGGRAVPGRYPEPASSLLMTNTQGAFKIDTLNTTKLKELGLISGVIFSDIDSDADPDIILAVEWGTIMLLRNENGVFSNATEEMGLNKYLGWWQGVTTGDLNEDGKLDIIATNWGLNNSYQNRYNAQHPLQLFYGDFDNNGTTDIIEAYYANKLQKLLPERSLNSMRRAMPTIAMRIPNNQTYSRSSVQELFGPRLTSARTLKANTLAHMVFLNKGDNFQGQKMPAEAQFSSAFYCGVADFDGDGHDDVFISQNFFALPKETSRTDAGRGLWLRGDGRGNLTAVPAGESGIEVYGEQRGAGLSDYDHDGRVDLVVSQNGAATRLFHNVGARPGLRVRLQGPKGNPDGVGAVIRLAYEDAYGPAREIHLGSGYWSQDSMVPVMTSANIATSVWVRWPGGAITEMPIPEGAREITVPYNQDLSTK